MLFSKVAMWYTWMKPNRLKNKTLKSHCKYIRSTFPMTVCVAQWIRVGFEWNEIHHALKCLKIIKPHKRWSAATMLKSPFESDVPTIYMYNYIPILPIYKGRGRYTIFHLGTQYEENIWVVKLRGYHGGALKF